MPVLGIESSAHTLGIGIVENGKVIANERLMYNITDKGIIPARVADFHAGNVKKALTRALNSADLRMGDIDAVGYTKGPGLGACLEVAQVAAKSLSGRYKVPIFPVNHAVAHIEIVKSVSGMKDPLAVYVSGGNSQILGISEEPYRHYHIYGETFDIGIGNMLDTFARAAKLNPAWGSTVAKSALGGKYIQMPYTVKGMDFTFTGLLTNAIGLLERNGLKDVSYSLQETAFSMLCEATERAMLLTRKRELALCGGVAQSDRLKEMLKAVSKSHGVLFGVAPNEFNADNGAMIAIVAERMLEMGIKVRKSECTVSQKYRIDKIRLV
ncbi:MAG: tRNA (adenosine(37)-N6)-threonylcarbamoyltransferase complex transferase subunit TsaD [Candidatus Micrarchaeota archaeon]|nr:tRNA (adenosine(37)-N6)-threonylcarbamoyltransferase complex transferase subunit TsaD [Candidatus Micrarchaeota archaeon]